MKTKKEAAQIVAALENEYPLAECFLDSETACDWDHPRAIINFMPNGKSYDMTEKVIIVEDEK